MSTPQPPAPPAKPSQPAPSSYQEMDSPSRSLPPIVPVLIAGVLVGAILFFIARSNRPVAPATGSISKVFAVEQSTKDRVLVGVEVNVKNSSDAAIYVKDAKVKVTLPAGQLEDTPAPADDVPRYLQAYPALKQSNAEWMGDNTKIMPGASRDGLFILGYQVTKDAWDKRKSVEVTINFYDQRPLILKQ
jgi:hypothetical protein